MTWNHVPDNMEQPSSLYGTGVPLIKNKAINLIIHSEQRCYTACWFIN